MVEKLKLEELGRVDIETFKQSEKIPVIVLLDGIRSMNNVGAVFRTADAFIIEKVVLCGITPQPPHREIHKAALGATESVDWNYEKDVTEALQKLKSEGYKILAIEQTTGSIALNEQVISKDEKYVVIMGNEVDGVSDEALALCDGFIEIPQLGTKHSLNVSVCAGIIMWEFFKNLNNGVPCFRN
ncbi:RNA methyltransferase [Elizabethkingia anophelis]|nr:RNA methyltransferase [Elizabethkingia anophelis]